MNKENPYISIKAYFQVNGIKVIQSKPVDKEELKWLDLSEIPDTKMFPDSFFDVFKIPAERFWPDKFSKEDIEDKRNSMSHRDFEREYLQSPAPTIEYDPINNPKQANFISRNYIDETCGTRLSYPRTTKSRKDRSWICPKCGQDMRYTICIC